MFDPAALTNRIGENIGTGEWLRIDQERVDAFADATLDHQWIHQTGPAADEGPFGGPIAHGFLTLSLLWHLTGSAPSVVEEAAMVINYGLDKVRFITPVPVGSRLRASVVLKEVVPIEGGAQITNAVTIELEGSERPAAYIEALIRVFG
ncbi:MAG: MaoC family dehydratase [Acidimicrobiia bacterium]|nr:MaoC family dehydratase [Acidimicrobiia bacterium]